MNICVYGSASCIDQSCLNAAKELGIYIGKGGHTLVYGGFGDGLLGEVAEQTRVNGGQVISVLPINPRKGHTEFPYSSVVLRSGDKRERKRMQEEHADIFVALPEGLGVLDELFETLLLKQYGELDKPIFIVNVDHRFDLLISVLKQQGCAGLFEVISDGDFSKIDEARRQ